MREQNAIAESKLWLNFTTAFNLSFSFFCAIDNIINTFDYVAGEQSLVLSPGDSQVCGMFGSVDDAIEPILEEVEFYQIALTTDDSADVVPDRSIANIFIEDNDGW